MKTNTGSITSLFMFTALLLWGSACSDDDGKESVITKQLKQLAGEWKAESVTFDAVAQEGYENFTLKIMASEAKVFYSATGSPSRAPWLLSGSLTPDEGTPGTNLVREDGVNIAYTVTDTTLEMEFTYHDTTGPGRGESVSGNWKFTFKK